MEMNSHHIDHLLDLTGLAAVVTGAGDGIGRATSLLLAAAGANVVASDLSPEKAQSTADEIISHGGDAVAVECDVTDETHLKRLVATAAERYGTVNILVNNAGGGGAGKEQPEKIEREYVERIFAMNLIAPWQLCKLVAPLMEKSGYGSIVNITSMSSVNRDGAIAIYASSKAALNHLTANLAFDLGPKGIRINCVGPGATRTKALASVLTPEIEARMLATTPLPRLGETSDIAQAVLFLAAPISSWISGQTLFVNGGGTQKLS